MNTHTHAKILFRNGKNMMVYMNNKKDILVRLSSSPVIYQNLLKLWIVVNGLLGILN